MRESLESRSLWGRPPSFSCVAPPPTPFVPPHPRCLHLSFSLSSSSSSPCSGENGSVLQVMRVLMCVGDEISEVFNSKGTLLWFCSWIKFARSKTVTLRLRGCCQTSAISVTYEIGFDIWLKSVLQFLSVKVIKTRSNFQDASDSKWRYFTTEYSRNDKSWSRKSETRVQAYQVHKSMMLLFLLTLCSHRIGDTQGRNQHVAVVNCQRLCLLRGESYFRWRPFPQ